MRVQICAAADWRDQHGRHVTSFVICADPFLRFAGLKSRHAQSVLGVPRRSFTPSFPHPYRRNPGRQRLLQELPIRCTLLRLGDTGIAPTGRPPRSRGTVCANRRTRGRPQLLALMGNETGLRTMTGVKLRTLGKSRNASIAHAIATLTNEAFSISQGGITLARTFGQRTKRMGISERKRVATRITALQHRIPMPTC